MNLSIDFGTQTCLEPLTVFNSVFVFLLFFEGFGGCGLGGGGFQNKGLRAQPSQREGMRIKIS